MDRITEEKWFDSPQDQELSPIIQTSSGRHPASYSVGTKGYFPGTTVAGSWSLLLTQSSADVHNEYTTSPHTPARHAYGHFHIRIITPSTDSIVNDSGPDHSRLSVPFIVSARVCFTSSLHITKYDVYSCSEWMTHTILHKLTQVYISSCSSSLDLFWPQLFYNTTMS
jgi:hypothetical protein